MANPRYVLLTDRARRVTAIGNPALAPDPKIVFNGSAGKTRFFADPFFSNPFFPS